MGWGPLIVAVTLGGQSGERTVEAAAREAAASQRPLRLVYIADTSFLDDVSREVHGQEDMADHLERIGRVILRRAESRARERTTAVETQVVTGDPVEVLSEMLEALQDVDVYIGRETLDVFGHHVARQELEALVEGSGGALRVV